MTIYDLSAGENGREIGLDTYRGNVLLIVNVASACGFTPQYAGLEFLYRRYKAAGLRVLAFPCNDFGAQEPGTGEEIRAFCSRQYGVTFDLFDKIRIAGGEAHPVYEHLTQSPGFAGEVAWNFEKFLVGRDGLTVGRFPSRTPPDDPELIGAIEAALSQTAP